MLISFIDRTPTRRPMAHNSFLINRAKSIDIYYYSAIQIDDYIAKISLIYYNDTMCVCFRCRPSRLWMLSSTVRVTKWGKKFGQLEWLVNKSYLTFLYQRNVDHHHSTFTREQSNHGIKLKIRSPFRHHRNKCTFHKVDHNDCRGGL